ncbi:DUF736 domain-containing protein [Beijerinckia indica]|uniref:DUF736 domain-containing protein n=1 Tax=Beijerinckia indica subsp. indica (strain ATCC 9039 / DSM 1715 / NCIMB 8712) TaxID=395963 RepID=B2IL63_BEII9|nr:DUF736 domain-containing protein [Beijerinckia indica]ACB97263.1 protein of unknown function DUF736 [Beijerinckia indica subsp. indica ATCC 9039]
MSVIGSFSYDASTKIYKGRIRTLTVNVQAQLVLNDKRLSEEAPLYRVRSSRNGAEIGAAWEKFTKDNGEAYLALKLDDPSFPAPIFGNLVEVEGEPDFQLIWSRPNNY